MKKFLTVLMAVVVLMSVVACSDNAPKVKEPTAAPTEPRVCDKCGASVEGIGYEYDGHVYCNKDCAGASVACARCGGDIEEILNKIKEENAIKDATNPIPGMSEPGSEAILYEGKLYCSVECAFPDYQ